jgi:hypothetical protein
MSNFQMSFLQLKVQTAKQMDFNNIEIIVFQYKMNLMNFQMIFIL